MPEWLEATWTWLVDHRGPIFLWLTILSVVTVVAAVVAMPLLIGRLPVDYFIDRPAEPSRRHPLWHGALWLVKNVVGLSLLLIGVALLLLPGQGLLMMLVGLMLMDFPGKRRLERAVARRPARWKALNWRRSKSGKPEFVSEAAEFSDVTSSAE